MKYNCDRCNASMVIDETIQTTWGGIPCTMGQYIELSKGNKNVWICCDDCINSLQDAWPYFESGEIKVAPTHKNN